MLNYDAIKKPIRKIYKASKLNSPFFFKEPFIKKAPFEASVALQDTKPVNEVDEYYLSFSIDISVLVGGSWWEGSSGVKKGLGVTKIAPLDLNTDKIDQFTQLLGPAYLRVGGSESDFISYKLYNNNPSSDPAITREIWDGLHSFIQRNNLKFVFTMKYGLTKSKQHGFWSSEEMESILSYSKDKGYRIDVCELGNELNAYWAFHGLRSQPRAKEVAKDYHTFNAKIKEYYPDIKILGPGSAFWPKLGETIKPFTNITKPFLVHCNNYDCQMDIVDWHYYPFQSSRSPVKTRSARTRNLLKPSSLNEFSKHAKYLKELRDTHHPEADLWTGETGSAQCGGQVNFSEKFASCFWWADQLGQGALLGQKVMIRQSLIGGEYGLIDRIKLKPRPDYWLTWLWKQLMGTQVFKLESNNRLLRTYCHSTANSKGKTLLFINLSAKPISINLNNLGKIKQQYELNAKSFESKKLRINGKKPKFNKGDITLESFNRKEFTNKLSGHSISFWLIE